MKKEAWYRICGSYFRQYCMTAGVFLVFAAIFALIFSLYDLETEAVFYALGLCILLAAAGLAFHFFSYWRKHERRRRILQNVSLLTDQMPKPETLAEADYQEMVYALKQLLDASLTNWQKERQESMDYYAAWVHQIKTPISVIQMILQEEDTEEHRELAAEMFRIEQYVEMVLSFLRLGSDSSDFVFQQYDLDAIIRQAVHKYAPQFVRKRLRLQYEPASVQVLTDEKWLLFILEQLLSNAVKYTQEGTITIAVTPEKLLKVSDTGIGIAPEDVPRIFEKGFTGYNGRADRKSTGLGLYLCRIAADRLSHKISVESVVGGGTVFTLDLHTDDLKVE